MSRALRNTLGAIERAIGIDAGGHEGRVWVKPEEARGARERMFELVDGIFPGMPWKLTALHAEIERTFPAKGYWTRAATAEEKRVLREHIARHFPITHLPNVGRFRRACRPPVGIGRSPIRGARRRERRPSANGLDHTP